MQVVLKRDERRTSVVLEANLIAPKVFEINIPKGLVGVTLVLSGDNFTLPQETTLHSSCHVPRTSQLDPV
jgi:hypothetical protein